MPDPSALRIALLSYRGNPYSGGQGVYVRQLSAALTRIGHHVTVFSGQPYPHLEDGIPFVAVPSLDLYREDDPFRTPRLREFRDWIDVLEYGYLCTAAFPEPLTFSLRARRLLAAQARSFDVVHDNQCLGWGMLGLHRAGLPLVASVHHAVVIDRDLELARETRLVRRLTLRRWYHFHRMQDSVARRVERVITVSEQSRRDIVEKMGVDAARTRVIPIAVDGSVFAPQPATARVPGRIFAVASADTSLKGVVPLLHAVAALRARREVELVVLGEARPNGAVAAAMTRLGLSGSVRFVRGIGEAEVARHYARGGGGRGARPSTRGSRSPRSRRWQVACRWWPRPPARCLRWWDVTARPASSSRRATPPPWRAPSGRSSTTRACAHGSARRRWPVAHAVQLGGDGAGHGRRVPRGGPRGPYHGATMSEETAPQHHHTLRERLDAAEAAADEVVAEESGQLGGEVNALAVPFEEIAAAVKAAIHPDDLAKDEVVSEKPAVSEDPEEEPPGS